MIKNKETNDSKYDESVEKRTNTTHIINKNNIKKYVLDRTNTLRPFWGCRRISTDFLVQVEIKIKGLINIAVSNHSDTHAKTFNPWPAREAPNKVKNCDFINVSKIKRYTMEMLHKYRPELNITQISSVFLYELNNRVEHILNSAIDSHPSIGKTFNPWGSL